MAAPDFQAAFAQVDDSLHGELVRHGALQSKNALNVFDEDARIERGASAFEVIGDHGEAGGGNGAIVGVSLGEAG